MNSFEVRVAAMMQQIEDGYNESGPDGLTLAESAKSWPSLRTSSS